MLVVELRVDSFEGWLIIELALVATAAEYFKPFEASEQQTSVVEPLEEA